MDEYSFISENGTVRQIRDLVAKAKDEEQDERITALEGAALGEWETIWEGAKSTTGSVSTTAPFSDYKEIMVAAATYSTGGQWYNIKTLVIPRSFLKPPNSGNYAFNISDARGTSERQMEFYIPNASSNVLEISYVNWESGRGGALLAIFGKK